MAGRPYLLDNLSDDGRHADALAYLLDDISGQHRLSIATGYVNLGGLHHVAVAVGEGRRVRLLIGAVPAAGLGAQFPTSRFELTLAGLRADRDFSRFPPSRAATQITAIDAWLQHPDVEVRRYTQKFLHGKAYMFGDAVDARAALVTSANLTAAGLFANLELGLVQYDPPVAATAVAWFDGLWGQAIDFKAELRELLFPEVGLISPRALYLRALLELLGPETDEPSGPLPAAVELAEFQLDGFHRALRILERHHGVIYADGVGTGKTEIGLALIEEYASRRGLHCLVVAPAQLVEYWNERLAQARLSAQVLSFHQLASDEQLADETPNVRRHLHSDKDAYRLVVVDEGHALRTPGTTWYRAVSRLLGGNQKDLALLTATPINNGLWDLYHLVMAFARHDTAFSAVGIPSLARLFTAAGANERDIENLDPDALFELADMVSVRRDRRFIEHHYRDATFPDGTRVAFPTPDLSTRRYDLDAAYPDLVKLITGHLSRLKMARYRPSAYRRVGVEEGSEATLGALLQSAILKRFESCWAACLLTINRMIADHDAFLAAWDAGTVLTGDALKQAAAAELNESGLAGWLEARLDDTEHLRVDAFKPTFRLDVSADRAVLGACAEALGGLDAEADPKLDLLQQLLAEVPSQKMIVFSTFADTVRYLDKHLPERVGGRARVAVIGADTDPDQRTAMLARLCPESVVRPGYAPPGGEVDLLLSNDVLSEGQNLQQAAAVISYDMPWNPQRVVQRYGRVVRLKSPHSKVSLTTMLPDAGDLELILQLETAIRRKIVAARPYGMEIEVVDADVGEEIRSYASRLEQGDQSLLDEVGELSENAAVNGELLRAELRRAAAEGEIERVRNMPWGIGAAFRQGQGVPSVGPTGVFLACRTRGGARYWRYVADDGTLALAPATILRRINPGNAVGAAGGSFNLDAAWTAAVVSIVEQQNEAARLEEGGSLGPVQKWARDLLQDAAVAAPSSAAQAYDALGVERSSLIRQELGAIKRALASGSITADDAARQVVEVVEFHGLRTVDVLPPIPKITEDDLGVVCWMAVLPGS